MRKVMFAFFISDFIPGFYQQYLIILANFSFLLILIYIVAKRLYISKIKILIKLINILCVLGI